MVCCRLIVRITHLHAQNYGWEPRITMEQMQQFLQLCLSRAGADSMITPREMLRDYMTVLHILMQNEGVSFEDVLGSAVTLKTERQEQEEQAEALASAQPTATPYVNFRPEDIDF